MGQVVGRDEVWHLPPDRPKEVLCVSSPRHLHCLHPSHPPRPRRSPCPDLHSVSRPRPRRPVRPWVSGWSTRSSWRPKLTGHRRRVSAGKRGTEVVSSWSVQGCQSERVVLSLWKGSLAASCSCWSVGVGVWRVSSSTCGRVSSGDDVGPDETLEASMNQSCVC